MKVKSILTTMIAGALMFTSTATFAEEVSKDVVKIEKQSEKRPDLFSHGPFEGITLDQKQKEELKILFKERKSHGDKSINPRHNMKMIVEMNKELKNETLSDNYSPEKIKEILKKYTSSYEEKVIFQSEIENKMYNVLNEEQKTKYKENIKKFEEKMEKFAENKRDMKEHQWKKPHPEQK